MTTERDATASVIRNVMCQCGDCERPLYAKGYCRLHYARLRRHGDPDMVLIPAEHRAYSRRPIEERFWEKVDKTGDCWLWTGPLNWAGYGRFSVGRGSQVVAHRVAYLMAVGPIPHGFEIDHLCKMRACVNPSHLDVVTHAENVLRSNAPNAIVARTNVCVRGHDLTPENTYVRLDGQGRQCRECNRIRWRRSA